MKSPFTRLYSIVCVLLLIATAAAQDDQLPGEETRDWPCAKRIDPSYIEVSEGTGGQILMLDPSESSKSMVLLEAQLKGIEETLFRAGGNITGLRDYEIPVDPSVEMITFSVFVQCIESIEILLPDGGEFKPGQGGPDDFVFRSGRVFTVEQPVPGNWHVRVRGKGYHSVMALARSEIALVDFDFVRAGGRPGHEGLFPMESVPPAGQEQMFEARISGTREAGVTVVSASGNALQDARITQSESTGDGIQLYGLFVVPSEPFRIVISGRDAKNFPWQRLHAPLWKPVLAR